MTDVRTQRWDEPLGPPPPPRSPWLLGDVFGVTVVNVIGLGLILGGLQGVRHTTDPHNLLLLVDIASAGLVVALAGNAVFLLSSLRQVGQLRTELLGRSTVTAAPVASPTSGELLATSSMTRYHRASCSAVQGKDAVAASLSKHVACGRLPCGLCVPESDGVSA